jgi:hypothetical protein
LKNVLSCFPKKSLSGTNAMSDRFFLIILFDRYLQTMKQYLF